MATGSLEGSGQTAKTPPYPSRSQEAPLVSPPSSISSHTANAVEQWTSCAAFDAHGSHAMVDCRHTAACVAVRSNQHTHEHKRQAQCSTWRAHSCTQHEISSTDRPRQTDSVYPRQPSASRRSVCAGVKSHDSSLTCFFLLLNLIFNLSGVDSEITPTTITPHTYRYKRLNFIGVRGNHPHRHPGPAARDSDTHVLIPYYIIQSQHVSLAGFF